MQKKYIIYLNYKLASDLSTIVVNGLRISFFNYQLKEFFVENEQ